MYLNIELLWIRLLTLYLRDESQSKCNQLKTRQNDNSFFWKSLLKMFILWGWINRVLDKDVDSRGYVGRGCCPGVQVVTVAWL